LRKAFLLIILALLIIIPGCSSPVTCNSQDKQTERLELIAEIKAFEKRLGFTETENFNTYAEDIEAYFHTFFSPSTQLAYSLDDPLLQSAEGRPEDLPYSLDGYDVFFYPIEALAGINTPITASLLEAPLHRLIHVVIHEDWHEQIDLPLGIEEPTGEVISYPVAMLFAEEKYSRNSKVYKELKKEFDNKLKESEIYKRYYHELDKLYSTYNTGEISLPETMSQKKQLLKSMSNEIMSLYGGRPDQLNNAYISFQMTYFRHLSTMHQIYQATNYDLIRTMELFRSIPGQGATYETMRQVIEKENEVIDYFKEQIK